MSPSPEVYLAYHFRNSKLYPIEDHYKRLSREMIFGLIEVLHEHICYYDLEYDEFNKSEAQLEFRENINMFLRFFDKGYFISEKGYVLELPNDALVKLIQSDFSVFISDDIVLKIQTAIKMYFHFSSNKEEKRKAINILVDILEPLREDLKRILNEEWEINKTKHDKLIFDIVNEFNIRHFKEVKNYSEDIWFEWMFHYYLSVINTYYRLKVASDVIR